MDRIFHARTAWYQYLLLILLTTNMVYFFWIRSIGIAVVLMLLLVVLIEQIIHTTYTVTKEGQLRVHTGRFRREKVCNLADVTRAISCRKMTIGRFSLVRYVLIECKNGSYLSLIPSQEEEFLNCIRKRINQPNSHTSL